MGCAKSVPIWSYSGPDFSRFFPHLDCTPYLSVFSPNAGKRVKNADQNNSEYGHFLCSDHFTETHFIFSIFVSMSRPRSIFVVSIGSVFDF